MKVWRIECDILPWQSRRQWQMQTPVKIFKISDRGHTHHSRKFYVRSSSHISTIARRPATKYLNVLLEHLPRTFSKLCGSYPCKLLSVFLASLIFLSPVSGIESQPSVSQSREEGLTIKFKASKEPSIRKAQEALVETWGYVTTQFLDTNFNGIDWRKQLQDSLDETSFAGSPKDVYKITDSMLSNLGDPFTRVIPPNVMGAFEDAMEGQIVGMGFQVGEDKTGARFVVFVAEGSPAERQGIRVGDRLMQINGQNASFLSKERLAASLRSTADVELERSNEDYETKSISLHLEAEPIETHPVQFAALPGSNQNVVGYVRLIVFSKNAPQDVERAIHALQEAKAQSFILDLRDNVGGVVLSGYEVAQLFLPAGSPFCFVEDGRGASEDVRLPESHILTKKPLVVLVNGGTASTAELIAASFQDNERAILIGEKTFGKGRTQRVIKLRDNGLLLLSNTTYLTPNHKIVDKVGLRPDVACKPDLTEAAFWNSGNQDNTQDLLDDPCIHMAVDRLTDLQM